MLKNHLLLKKCKLWELNTITYISIHKEKNVMFCPKCSSLLVPKKGRTKVAFYCSKCDKKYYPKKKVKVKEKTQEKKDKVIFMQSVKDDNTLPKTSADCPKCKHDKAFYWIVQTRASDEPPTKFLKCEKCEHRWRDYG
ncbi:MAG: transcription factor S [Candidatus Nanoarchaeia archaeon]